MADTPSDPEAPAASPALSGAVLAAGAGVLAGLVLGRRGAASVAAGVAAAASMRLLAGSSSSAAAPVARSAGPPIPQPPFPPAPSLFPSVKPEPVAGDWVDHDAVLYSHIVPDVSKAGEMLKEKSLPLLDDDGLPVEHVTVQPVYPDDVTESYNFPLGPIIWEPGRFVQSHSDGTGETVWFGLQDLLRESEQPEEIVVETIPLEPAPPAEVALVEESHPEEEVVEAPMVPAQSSGTASPYLRELAEALYPAAPKAAPCPPPSVDVTDAGTTHLGEVTITAKSTGKTVLPQPRPRQTPPAQPKKDVGGADLNDEQAKDVQTLLDKILPDSGARIGDHGRPRHHVAPRAPSQDSQTGERWPLVLLLCALIIAGLFFAVGWLDDGTFFRRLEKLPGLEQKTRTPEQTTSAIRQ